MHDFSNNRSTSASGSKAEADAKAALMARFGFTKFVAAGSAVDIPKHKTFDEEGAGILTE